MIEIINKINALKAEYDDLKPIEQENNALLWEKFRLEWNYNSNHIEGNTMTYGETKLLLRLGDDFKAQNNTLKDVNEMRAHDTAIFLVKEWAQENNRDLIEKDIRELNEIILVKDYWADAQTADGQATRRLIKVGEYKAQPNHVQLKSGEIFRYAEPLDVPIKMRELIDWYNSVDEEEHPLITAAFLHYKFVIIHPFDDGNGRVSRLLMNYHLLKNGFPPLIIKSADKNNYLYALNQADTGNTDAFVEYLGEQLIWSLELTIKAAKGESIAEKDDLNKEIEVWKKGIKSEIPEKLKRDNNLANSLFRNSITRLFFKIKDETDIFQDLFLSSKIDSSIKIYQEEDWSSNYLFEPNSSLILHPDSLIEKYKFEIFFQKLLKSLYEKDINISSKMVINLNIFDYTISIDGEDQGIKKAYNEFLSEEEMEELSVTFKRILFEKVKKVTQ